MGENGTRNPRRDALIAAIEDYERSDAAFAKIADDRAREDARHHEELKRIGKATEEFSRHYDRAGREIERAIKEEAQKHGVDPYKFVLVCGDRACALMNDEGYVVTYHAIRVDPATDAVSVLRRAASASTVGDLTDEELAESAAYEAIHDVAGPEAADAWAALGQPFNGHPAIAATFTAIDNEVS